MAQPSKAFEESELSVVEDLDPEEGRGVGGKVRLDWLLGIPLVVMVLGFVGWNWWHRSYQSDQYFLAQQTQGNGDLDGALRLYGEAAGYDQADSMIATLGKQIKERDRLYKSAVGYADSEQWIAALRDIRDVGKIQAGFKDTVEIEDSAIRHIYSDALSGTVVLREKATPPGLYYRGTAGWLWLEGSDTLSRLYGRTANGYLVFDVANQDTAATPEPAPGQYAYSFGRRFVVAHVQGGGTITYAGSSIDSNLFYPTAIGKNGFWAMNFGSSLLDGTDDQSKYLLPVVEKPFHSYNMAYQAYGSEDARYVPLRATEASDTGSVILAVNYDDNRYLVAEWTGAKASGPGEKTLVKVYLRAAGEELNRPVFTYEGGAIQSGVMSPDGGYAIITAYKEFDEGDERYNRVTMSLIDLEGTGGPKTIREVVTNRNPARHPQAGLKGEFVHTGAYAGKALVYENAPGNTYFRLIDPEKVGAGNEAEYVLKRAELLYNVNAAWRIREQDDGGIVITAQTYEKAEGMAEKTYTLHAIVFPVDGPFETYRIISGSTGVMSLMRASGTYIRWSDVDYGSVQSPSVITRSVYSTDLTGGEASEASARLEFATDDMPWRESLSLGDDLMVYIVGIVSNSEKEDWLSVLRDAREMGKLQPGYKDVDALEEEAIDGVYGGILSGTITLRVHAAPVGLYLRTGDAWKYLKDSDLYSVVQVAPRDGEFVYDVPDPGWVPAGQPNGSLSGESNMRGRHLVRGVYKGGGEFSYMDLTLDPSQYTSLQASKGGLWGIHYGNGGVAFYDPSTAVVRTYFFNCEVAYQPYNDGTIGYAPLPPTSGEKKQIVALDEHSNRYLMAEWNESGPQKSISYTTVDVYLMTAGSNVKRLIYSKAGGGIVNAQFDASGRYILIHTFDAHGVYEDEIQSIVLVDLEAGRTVTQGDPIAKATKVREATLSPSNYATQQSWLGAAFVPEGAYAGDIVLTEYRYSSSLVKVIDPGVAATGEAGVVVEVSVDVSKLKNWIFTTDGKDGLRLIGSDSESANMAGSTFDVVTIGEKGGAEVERFNMPSGAFPMNSRSIQGGVAWQTYRYVPNVIPDENNVYISVFSTANEQMIGTISANSLTIAFNQGLQHTQSQNRRLMPSILLGDRFFAYTLDDDLRLRSYDGKDDLLLESKVQSIVGQIRQGEYWTYVR